MKPRKILTFGLLIILAVFVLSGVPLRSSLAQQGTCCSADWKLPLPAGNWLITQGDRDSCVSSHCPGGGVVNEYALDIVADTGKDDDTLGVPILSPADGTVLDKFWDPYGGGNVLKVEHGDGGPVSVYFHIQDYLVKKGDTVAQGKPVATIGKSGREWYQPHLHVFVLKNRTQKIGLKINSWDGNTNFATGAVIKSTNGSGSEPTPIAPPAVLSKPMLSQPENNSVLSENSSVALSWKPVSSAFQYKVEIWGGQYDQVMTPCSWQAETTCRIGTMWPGTMYWHVKARGTGGLESEWSDTWTFTVSGSQSASPTPSPVPAFLSAPDLRKPRNGKSFSTSTDIWFEWNYVSGATEYYLEYWGGPYGTLNSGWITDVAYHIGTMWPGTYSWHVKSRNSGQESPWSNTWTFIVQDVAPTPTAAALVVNPPSLSSPADGSTWPQTTEITLKWSASENATKYKVELWGGPYSLMTPCDWQTGRSCYIGTMWPGIMYWHVKALGVDGQESAWSDTWSFTIQEAQPTFQGNIAPRCNRTPDGIGSNNAFDGNLSTFWTDGLGHQFTLELRLPDPMEVSRIIVWDRPQNSPDNNQINALIIRLSNGLEKRFDMNSQGARCIDVTLTPQVISSVTLKAHDSSGNNGLSEVEIWVGPKTGGPTCSNTGRMP